MGMFVCLGLVPSVFFSTGRCQTKRVFPTPIAGLSRTCKASGSDWGGCVRSAVILMLQAAGSEPHVAPHVLKTILLILKGKPGEKPGNLMDRRRFSIDATNMMPVAVTSPCVSCSCCRSPDHENSYLPSHLVILPWHSPALIHSFLHPSIHHIFTERLVCAPPCSWSFHSGKRRQQWTDTYVIYQKTGSLEEI